MPAQLTPTSYSILGLLAIKPWTTYELAQQMQRALGQFWPRAESKLYEEPKKLVAHGLARARLGTVGKRPHTEYSITPKGRRALATWMTKPGKGPVLEFEDLIKVFFAEHGTKTDLLATIKRIQEQNDQHFTLAVAICRDYLDGQGPFPERLPWLILVGQFLNEFDQAVARWAAWAQEAVEAWPDDPRQASPDWATLEAMAQDAQSHVRREAPKTP
jgi:PadR family transcriptional regulator AphA